MITDLQNNSSLRTLPGYRSSGVIPYSLPDSQALLEISFREAEATLSESKTKLAALKEQIRGSKHPVDQQSIERARHALRGINAACLKHLKVIQERIAMRHHPQGRFGSTIVRLRAELEDTIDCLALDQRRLGELSAEQDLALVVRCLDLIAVKFRGSIDQLTAQLQELRKVHHQARSFVFNSNSRAPFERTQIRERLARSLTRWWQTCTVMPGPMTIAVIDVHRLAVDYPELDRQAAAELLNSAASLIVSDRRTGRAGVAIDTTVTSSQGDERNIAWSCAVIEDNKGHVESIIAAGLEKSRPTRTKGTPTAPGEIAGGQQIPQPCPPAAAERRRKQRNPFPYVQLIAPTSASGLPATSAFSEMLCHDISEDGFSFLSAAMPTATSLVVALGTRPPHLYMTARVAHFTHCDTVLGSKYIVGCQFTGRAMLMAQFP